MLACSLSYVLCAVLYCRHMSTYRVRTFGPILFDKLFRIKFVSTLRVTLLYGTQACQMQTEGAGHSVLSYTGVSFLLTTNIWNLEVREDSRWLSTRVQSLLY